MTCEIIELVRAKLQVVFSNTAKSRSWQASKCSLPPAILVPASYSSTRQPFFTSSTFCILIFLHLVFAFDLFAHQHGRSFQSRPFWPSIHLCSLCAISRCTPIELFASHLGSRPPRDPYSSNTKTHRPKSIGRTHRCNVYPAPFTDRPSRC